MSDLGKFAIDNPIKTALIAMFVVPSLIWAGVTMVRGYPTPEKREPREPSGGGGSGSKVGG